MNPTKLSPIRLLPAIVFALAPGFALAPSPALAAHAGAPYTNVDHSNDMGNDTGDSQVEGLNAGQLNENYRGPLQMRQPATNPPATQVVPHQMPLAPPAR